jgi:hypothetical protein
MSQKTDRRDRQEGGLELPSIKELSFDLQGREFHARSGYASLYEETKTLRYFDEIRRSWQIAIRGFNVGTPKGLKPDSIAERELLEFLFMELRHGDSDVAFEKYSALIKKHLKDPVFRAAIARTIEHRSIPNDARLSLPFYVLAGWIHGFLWGLSNDDRADTLRRLYGIAIRSDVRGESEVVRKTIARLKLKSWSDYRDAYPKPPLSLLLFRDKEGKQEQCQLVFRSTGHS